MAMSQSRKRSLEAAQEDEAKQEKNVLQEDEAKQEDEAPGPTVDNNPLENALSRVCAWFEHEREHGVKVRTKDVFQQTKYELEYERDRQLALQRHNSHKFHLPTLNKCEEKLQIAQVRGLVWSRACMAKWMEELEDRKNTTSVVLDETAPWLKPRAEEKVRGEKPDRFKQ